MSPGDEPPRSRQEDLEARLTGLALILGGVVGLGVVYLLWLFAPATMPVPPGMPRNLLPLTSPLNCMLPVVAIGSSALVLIGLRKLILGD
jgi:hypothetical protein